MVTDTALSHSTPPQSLAVRVAEMLADADARAVLVLLEGRGESIEVAELAAEVAAKGCGQEPGAVSEQTRREHQRTLYHRTLPRLESLGLVDLDRKRRTVRLGDVSTTGSVGIDLAALDADTSVPWEVLATVLAEPRRLSVLTALADDPGCSFEDLAIAVAAREHDLPRARLSDEQVREVEIVLHHADLPKLAEVGLVDHCWRDGPILLCADRLERVADTWSLVFTEAGQNA